MAGRSATKRTSPRRSGRSAEERAGETAANSTSVQVLPGAEHGARSTYTVASFIAFLKAVQVESKRVTWPTVGEVRQATIAVMMLLMIFCVYLGVLDKFFIFVFQWGQHR
jgi:preprotein translocase SecE subunit